MNKHIHLNITINMSDGRTSGTNAISHTSVSAGITNTHASMITSEYKHECEYEV